MIVEIIWSSLISIIVGIIVNSLLFRLWHKNAHSKKLRLEEEKQKEKEWEELGMGRIID